MAAQKDRPDEDGPNFIHDIVDEERPSVVHTRFPPEPNGYLHIGHAKSICLNFGTALKYGGQCNLRLDDTNPTREDVEYVDSIKQDVRWLGFDWEDREFYASDYYQQLHDWAVQLVEAGKAYVDSSTAEEIREGRGDFHRPGKDSPHRTRSIQENLELFERMKAGEFEDGAHVLRAKIDMQSANLNLRDPTMYRILRVSHHRTGDDWCIYPMYDYAHGQSDALEGITHSLCTLEFEDHRPLYDWFLEALQLPHRPRQIEFAPLNLSFTVLSKRLLKRLVDEGIVDGWDDPRMPTLAGLRRRGFTPAALRAFCDRIGVSKRGGVVDVSLLEYIQREQLNAETPRVMVVQRPLRVVIENYPEDGEEFFEATNHPEYADRGTRKVPFCRELFIEQEDFHEDPPKKWFRLAPGREVRLRYACLITCREAIKDDDGHVVELRCTWDPESRGGTPADGRKVKGTLHWVSARHGQPATVRLYDRLFDRENPLGDSDGENFTSRLNPTSLEVLEGCLTEPGLGQLEPGARVQFERLGYYCVDGGSTPGAPVFNRTLALRDSWAKIENKRS